MVDVKLSIQAYAKLLLHAAKYPHCPVNGLLLCEDPRKKNQVEKDLPKPYRITDSIPLFHVNLNLTPMLEVALTHIDSYCKQSGLVICGYYQANELIGDSEPDLVALRTSDKVREHFPGASLFVVDNAKLTQYPSDCAVKVYQFKENSWKLVKEKSDFLEHRSPAVVSALLSSNAHRDLIDFDNFLDDISIGLSSWRNTHLNDFIQKIV